VLVYRDGEDAAAKDCRTGRIIARGRDHAYVIQMAIDDVAPPSDKCNSTLCERQAVVALRGSFTLSTPLRMRSGVLLVGPATLSLSLPIIDNVGNPAYHCGLLHLIIDGNKASAVAVQGYFVRCLFAYNLIRRYDVGIFLQEGSGVNRIIGNTIILTKKGIEIRGSDNMVAFNDIGQVMDPNLASYDPDYLFQDAGIYLNNASVDYNADNNRIIGNEIWGFKWGIRQYDPNNKIGANIIIGNMIQRNGLQGISVWGGRTLVIVGNVVRSNGELQSANEWERAAVLLDGGVKAIVHGNVFVDQYMGYQLYGLYVGDAEVWLGHNMSLTPDNYTAYAVVHNLVVYVLSDCTNLPIAGIYVGDNYACYDATAAKWVLKVWDGSAWQTIG